MGLESCANCERMIGKMETPFLFLGEMVCRECNDRLSQSTVVPSAPSIVEKLPAEASNRAGPTTITVSGKTIAIAHITSSSVTEEELYPIGGWILAVAGVLMVPVTLAIAKSGENWLPALLIGIAALLAGLFVIARHRPTYGLLVTEASGNKDHLSVPDQETAYRIHAQIVAAIEIRALR